MTELEKLLNQRRQINEQIKCLKNQAVVCDGAKLDKTTYPTDRPDEWYIAIATRGEPTVIRNCWRSVIRSNSKETAIAEIDSVISDLQELRDKLKGV